MNEEEGKQLFWYRVKLVTLIVVFLSPFIGGWMALYVFDIRPASGNYGTLVQPIKKLDWPQLQTFDGGRLEDGFKRKWVFVLFAGDACGTQCRSNLFYMRQLRTLLGRNTLRLQNVLISAKPLSAETRTYLQEFPNFKVIEDNRDAALYQQFYLEGLGEVGSTPRMYLVDPAQNLMMHYPAQSDQDRMLEDIRRLMKLSQIG